MAYINGNRTLQVVRTKYMDLDDFYPIGSVYVSFNSTSPASLFGGTWERISNKFLYGTSNDQELGDTGGNSTHTHTLGNGYAKVDFRSSRLNLYRKTTAIWTGNIKTDFDMNTDDSGYGGNQSVELGGKTDSGDSMPPLIKVAIWKRTA